MVTTNNTIRNLKKFPLNPIRVRVEVGGWGGIFWSWVVPKCIIWYDSFMLCFPPSAQCYLLCSQFVPNNRTLYLICLPKVLLLWTNHTHIHNVTTKHKSSTSHTFNKKSWGVMVVVFSQQNLIKGNWFFIFLQFPMFPHHPHVKIKVIDHLGD